MATRALIAIRPAPTNMQAPGMLPKKMCIRDSIKVTLKVEDEARKIVADRTYINRIMYNLVNNGVQAMPKGGKLTLCVFKEANDTIITVKDTGVGIPEAAKDKLFTPMFTLSLIHI